MTRWTIPLSMLLLAALSHPSRAADLTPQQQASHVLNRLAFGPRPGDIDRVLSIGVPQYIEQQLAPAQQPLPDSLTRQLAAIDIDREPAGRTLADFLVARASVKNDDEDARRQRRATIVRIAEQTAQARLTRAIDSPRQLEEVMVDFWFNHFNVFSGKGLDRALINGYERDAIRPHVMGSFRELLGATAKHPAMLFYLDNWTSTGAGTRAAGAGVKAKATGLNENYARELMELHTLGVDGGYTQQDVTALARMLTGWSFDPRAMARGGEQFRFDAARHDTGTKLWLGHEIVNQGQAEGEYALDILAQHPATAHRISYQLAQYFVQDAPPAALVDRLAQRYLATSGDIRSVLRTLFASPEFMAPEALGAKFKTPFQFVVSAVRATGVPVRQVRPLLGTLAQLGMPLYGCQTPDGYRNTQAAWLNPDAITRRIAFGTALGTGRVALSAAPTPVALAGDTMAGDMSGAMATERTTNIVNDMANAGAGTPAAPVDAPALVATLGSSISAQTLGIVNRNPQALRAAMLLGAPDFMQH